LVRQGGERLSACATKATQPFERQLSLLTRSVTRPSLGPRARARRSSLTSSVKAVEGGALGGGSRLGKPGNRRNQHRTFVAADEARLDAHSDSRKRDPGASEKEGGCGLRPFEELESPGRSARTSYAVAEVVRGGIWSRISSRAAPSKRERGASERGPSSVWALAVTRRRARRAKRCRHVDPSPLKTAEGRQRPRVAWERHPPVATSPERWSGGRGTGAAV